MKKFVPALLALLILTGCGAKDHFQISSSATFEPKDNENLKGQVVPLGFLDKIITIEGSPKTPFLITVGISGKRGSASGSSSSEILFKMEDEKLLPLMDWEMAGGGERPALRRENDTGITIYYPSTIDEQRTWVKFKVVVKK